MLLLTIACFTGLVFAVLTLWALFIFRTVVPTNMMHIVQSSKASKAYGKSSDNGNVYYAWPAFLPIIGVTVSSFPESIFEITLDKYEAYDSKRLPFLVTVSAFFRIMNPTDAAQRVSSFKELNEQLSKVVQGAVRRVLAEHGLNDIMQMRGELGEAFTSQVQEQVAQWGAVPVKALELMDLRDAPGSSAIADIMEMEQSRIESVSRTAVAENKRAAEIAVIQAQQAIDLSNEEARQSVGQRRAQVEESVGIATEQANQRVAAERKQTTLLDMAVVREREVATASIAKDVATTKAQEQAEVLSISAEADRIAANKRAEAALAEGKARAESEALMLQAPVTAQLNLATGIGANLDYQRYLIMVDQVAASRDVGLRMAEALSNASLHVIANGGGVNGGGNIMEGTQGLLKMFDPQVGTQLAGMATALNATPEGAKLFGSLSDSKMTAIAAGASLGATTGSPAAAAAAAAMLTPAPAQA